MIPEHIALRLKNGLLVTMRALNTRETAEDHQKYLRLLNIDTKTGDPPYLTTFHFGSSEFHGICLQSAVVIVTSMLETKLLEIALYWFEGCIIGETVVPSDDRHATRSPQKARELRELLRQAVAKNLSPNIIALTLNTEGKP
jgi:hypothetical protein